MFYSLFFLLFQSLMTPLAGFAFSPLPSSSLFFLMYIFQCLSPALNEATHDKPDVY